MGEKLDTRTDPFAAAEAEVSAQVGRFLKVRGKRSVQSIHRELGKIMWEHCGMARNAAGLQEALEKIPALRQEFHDNVNVLGTGESLNQSLEKAGRVSDFLELGELMCKDALERSESCGGHFREESQTAEGEALRDDDKFSYVAAWQNLGAGKGWALHKEPLAFEHVHLAQRSYK
jgi:succinate dehydrogenase / fumarate reductase flavoprotein subunit